ncbi:bacillithiol biosynthesis protein BshC, partial [Paenibacillus darwinianus]
SHSTRADSRQVAEVLAAFNRKAGASARTEANVEALGAGAPVVVGGQQAGLLTGPLMVIHKAVSVINAANWAEKELGQKVVPIFWIAGEDHDWDEANHASVVTTGSGLRKLAVDREGKPRTSVSRTTLDQAVWNTVLGELADSLPDTAFKPELLEALKLAAASSATLTDMFARIMASLFANEGLVMMDADDPALRRLEAPMFIRMLENGRELERAYAASSSRLTGLGYALQVEPQPGCANLFVYRDPAVDPNAGRLAG